MYKKVTHSIVEEHFAHPMAQEIKKMVDGDIKMSAAWPLTPTSQQFFNQLKKQFTEFNTALRNVITGVGTNDPSLDYNKKRLTELTAAFGPFFEPYYGQAAAESAVGHIAEFAKSIENAVIAANAKGDWNTPAAAALEHLNALAALVTSWNPEYWKKIYPSLGTYLLQYFQYTVNQISKRVEKDWDGDFNAANVARIIVSQGPMGSLTPFNSNSPDLSYLLAGMITQQFPEKFSA